MNHSHDSFVAHFFEDIFGQILLDEKAIEFAVHLMTDLVTILGLFFAITIGVSLLSGTPLLAKLKGRLKDASGASGYFIAMAAGVFSPFCSCTIVPVFAGLLSVGVPIGYLFTFLTTASMLNLSTLITLGMWGSRGLFLVYVLFSALLCFLSGYNRWIRDTKNTGLPVEICNCACDCGHHHAEEERVSNKKRKKGILAIHREVHFEGGAGRLIHVLKDTLHILREVFPWVILSVGVSAALAHLVPDSMETFTGGGVPTNVLAVIFGILIHPDIFSALPFLELFTQASTGTGILFLLFGMSVSVPGTAMIFKIVKPIVVIKYIASVLLMAGIFAWCAMTLV